MKVPHVNWKKPGSSPKTLYDILIAGRFLLRFSLCWKTTVWMLFLLHCNRKVTVGGIAMELILLQPFFAFLAIFDISVILYNENNDQTSMNRTVSCHTCWKLTRCRPLRWFISIWPLYTVPNTLIPKCHHKVYVHNFSAIHSKRMGQTTQSLSNLKEVLITSAREKFDCQWYGSVWFYAVVSLSCQCRCFPFYSAAISQEPSRIANFSTFW